MYYTSEDSELIKAWEIAALDLDLEIISPLKMTTENGLVIYPLLIKNFGGINGTIIVRYNHIINSPLPKHKDYYSSAVNAEVYSVYNREKFIETLEDWGFYGDVRNKPEWYNGNIYK